MPRLLILPVSALLALASVAAHAVTCTNNLPPANPDAIYSTNDDRVLDTRTGLTWTRCAEGQTWDGISACSGSPSFHTWLAALELAESRSSGGQGDWRLPNLKELLTLVETCRDEPAINDHVFPNAAVGFNESFSFWSSTPYARSPTQDEAWFVRSGRGDTGNDPRGTSKMLRMVRGPD